MKKYADIVLVAVGIVSLCVWLVYVYFVLVQDNKFLRCKVEFYEEESLRSGQIVSIDNNAIYVFDELKERIIEVDAYEELVHCDIEIGDYAVYRVDYEYTDADLLNVIKREEFEGQ